ncbi:alpha/beta fold hydrolase [Halalkalibacter sp. APA_J-10(15)]|uniref:alpha/beta fold hydrolase n=1 Tax=unclassified Halalkalibacter TaxID=2893063 RepID=UPI001FF51D65|nr:alpha/beta fold hydrolase [Halalkalibacter sp. APA_J-10(15)]MCK0471174.1 alpha/beta fold hydrolase [Halalkalibacter sp. APA_J-10(15)]
MKDYEIYSLGDVVLQSGQTLPQAFLAYKTYGTLNATKSNAIVYPTWFAGHHTDNEWLIGPDKALDPDKYFIIVPNMLGNGLSSSPSNTPAPLDRSKFPLITIYDNVRLQHRIVTEKFGITKLALVVGWSLGALQTFQWGASYPEMVERIAPFGGTAKTRPHAQVVFEGLIATLQADSNWKKGFYTSQPIAGLSAMGRAYAPWGFSQAYYLEKLYQAEGYSTLESYLKDYWDQVFFSFDANDLIAMLRTGVYGDISNNPTDNGNFEQALNRITAHALVMPGSTDLFFTPEDNAYEIEHMPNAIFQPIESKWGHCFGIGQNEQDSLMIDNHLKQFLQLG